MRSRRWRAGPGVLADIARQYRERDRRDLDAHPDDRLPRAALRRHTQIRDRTCVGIGCRHRPTRCDQDHTVDYRYGGPPSPPTWHRCAATTTPSRGSRLDPPTAEPRHVPLDQPLGGDTRSSPSPSSPLPDPCPGPDNHQHDQPAPQAPDSLTLWKPDPPPSPPGGDAEPTDLDTPPPF